jgi:hypothetical protein
MSAPGPDPVGDVLASMRRDLNCLTDSDRAIRKRGLTRVHQRYEACRSWRLRLPRPGQRVRAAPMSFVVSQWTVAFVWPTSLTPSPRPWLTARRPTAARPAWHHHRGARIDIGPSTSVWPHA